MSKEKVSPIIIRPAVGYAIVALLVVIVLFLALIGVFLINESQKAQWWSCEDLKEDFERRLLSLLRSSASDRTRAKDAWIERGIKRCDFWERRKPALDK